MTNKILKFIKFILKQSFIWIGYILLAYILLFPLEWLKYQYTKITPYLGIYSWTTGRVWVPFGSPVSRFMGLYLLPDNISKSRNCNEFQEWQGANIPMFLNGTCPWFVYTPFYDVTVNTTNFKIPREKLGSGEFDSIDTPAYLVRLKNFDYPLILTDPENAYTGYAKNVVFKIFGGYTKDPRYDTRGFYQHPIDSTFWQFLHIDPNERKYVIDRFGYSEEDGYYKYRFRLYNKKTNELFRRGKFIYTNDPIAKSKDFIVCDEISDGKRCYTIFPYKDVYVEFSFYRELVSEKDNIKKVIYKWLEEWEAAAI